ncbi:MotA/TolQ/ExbB proton channel family protein [Psychrobacter maritimus]|uniref:MotA/TolQ/ExbB proton channel family protein n=1 Tax=Psychrobacter maritimus TaxID=256325 RepID=UPI00191A6BA3|nr:MotA/TolQ/ExbB proton channel family protein [Psychrobacter maritimus]
MWELVKAGGWLMTPIVVCSILALVIIIERSHTLRFNKIAPNRLREQLITRLRENGDIGRTQLMNVKEKTPLGDILATGLLYRQYGLDSMTMHMQNRASVQVHQLEKNINMLGTIGAIAPLLGLLGTVLGIISSFLAITDGAMQDPTMLAAGVSQALITTAAGMIVAIPALVAYRYFQRRIIDINAQFETQAGLMIQELYDYQLLDNTQASTISLPTNGLETTKTKGYELSIDTSDLETAATAT